MEHPMNILSGYKTYITAAAGVLAAAASYASGEISLGAAIGVVFASVLATFVRSGSKTDAAAAVSAVAGVAAQLAPIAEKLLPEQAGTIGKVAEVAAEIGQAVAPAPAA
jgi:hypothetical protein